MGDQDHWTRKMITYFKRFDIDCDGTLSKADYAAMAKSFSDRLDAEKGKALTEEILTLSDRFFDILGGSSVGPEAFITSISKWIEDPIVKPKLEAVMSMFFNVIDTNKDGLISKEEYQVFFDILGMKEAGLADAAFAAIDTNNDGKLSKEEFFKAGTDFFFIKDGEHPSDIFWGPLL